jgi:hypothetical protein
MTKPHEETWIADDEYGITYPDRDVLDDGRSFVKPIADFHIPNFLDDHARKFTDDEKARAALAAQAPAMARLLLEIVDLDVIDFDLGNACGEPTFRARVEAVLRAAGVLLS